MTNEIIVQYMKGKWFRADWQWLRAMIDIVEYLGCETNVVAIWKQKSNEPSSN
jgi:ATP:corrinoid adenosyltransferase